MEFELISNYKPAGSQPVAIKQLTDGIFAGKNSQVLLGVTGSGKTFTMANVIKNCGRPALVIAHNKTLAAQLCNEFRQFFPHNRVEYFVSYYDYYQPEAYLPASDTYIDKDMSINDEIDKLRHSATSALAERRDTIIVASVSCIYGLGGPKEYYDLAISLRPNQQLKRADIVRRLIEIQYKRADVDFVRGSFRVNGDTVDIIPSYSSTVAIRVQFFGDEIENIYEIDAITGTKISSLSHIAIFPATHYAVGSDKLKDAIKHIRADLEIRIKEFEESGRMLEAHRIKQRTNYDMELLEEIGFCKGIENYSRYFDGRKPKEPPYTLMSYFPKDYITFIDESHITVPQIRGMWGGDRSRKENLVEFGFRLPSAYDNRPLNFNEFNSRLGQCVYVSATPEKYETERSGGDVVEQIIRPTGLIDPEIFVESKDNQIPALLTEIRKITNAGGKTINGRAGNDNKDAGSGTIANSVVSNVSDTITNDGGVGGGGNKITTNGGGGKTIGGKILVTTLTKKMAEDLTGYLTDNSVRVRYLHSDIDTLERVEIINALRKDEFDVIVGINLLREGLDIPEVELVAILDADKEGLFRSERSLIQTIGRASRNAKARVIMYANVITPSMRRAIDETNRRRTLQMEYNRKHKITPKTVYSEIKN
ncbi:MAG: excinuclease ABC subunit UvrB, partial [Christensenellaceae bacterium]|nr:excinuclease ABC subunit UvrB [Christensenellaceae bacterium]